MAHEPDIAALIPGFLEEVGDRIDAIERDLEAIAHAPDPAPLLARIIGALHTIKGSASCLSLFDLAGAAHRAEAVLEAWRAKPGQAPDRPTLQALAGAVTGIGAILDALAPRDACVRHPGGRSDRLTLRAVLEHHAALARARAAEQRREVAVEVAVAPDADLALEQRVVRSLCPALLHALNNCVDHGAQPASARIAAGKPLATRIIIGAEMRAGGRLSLAIADDGPGLDREAICRRAAALGRTIPAGLLDDAALEWLVFQGGLSTSDHPSIRAGRGVGLETVRMAISDMGGSVRVLSAPGRGTTVSFLIPVLNPSIGNTDTGSESADAA